MPNERILIIDDDRELTEMLTEYLAGFGFSVSATGDPRQALTLFNQVKPGIILLDIMLPYQGGLEVCRELRKVSPVPILFLSARGEVSDKIVGLELGGDDYLAKPFEPRELVARIHSLLRRASPLPASRVLRAADLSVDLNKRSVRFRESELVLTQLEFELLALFIQAPFKVFSRDEIATQLKRMNVDSLDRSVDIAISRLRQRLGDDPKKPTYLKTVWGSGYIFIAEVTYGS